MKRLPISQKLVYEKFYVLKIAAVNLPRLLFPEKRKENMQTKQPQFNSRLSKPFFNS